MLTFFHAPRSRSSRILWLLEELGVPYDTKLVEIKRRDGSGGADEAYRVVNPHLKVPSVVHDGHPVIESSAICLYLADAFPAAKLAVPIGDPERADYVTWLVYSGADFEPAIIGKLLQWKNLAYSIADPDEVVDHVERTLGQSDYIVGAQFTAADIMICSVLQFAMEVSKVIPPRPIFEAYVKRCTSRPACVRALAKDATG